MIAINVIFAGLARNAIGRRQAALIRSAPPCTDLFFGHSLIAGGIDPASYDSARPGRRALNIGLNSTGPVEHLLMLETAAAQRPRRLFYGFLNDQLTHDPTDDPLSDLVGNRALCFYAGSYDVAAGRGLYAGASWSRRCRLLAGATVPMLGEQGTLWMKVERGRRWLGSLGLLAARANRFGRVGDMAALGGDEHQVRAAVRRQVEGRTPLSEPVRAMLAWARRRDATFYLILMPATAAHRRKYYDSAEFAIYSRNIEKMLRNDGGILLDCRDWIDDDLFEDENHLDRRGAVDFSTKLARRVPERGPGPAGGSPAP